MMTWSQKLPWLASSGSRGSQCLSFFPHEGPGLVDLDLFGLDAPDGAVMEEFGVLAEASDEAQDGVAADLAQPGCGADAAAVGEVLGDGGERALTGGEAEQRGVGALGEVGAAGGTAQAADAPGLAGPSVQAQVGCPAPPV